MDTNNAMKLIIVATVMFVVLGGTTLLSHWYTLNGIKNRTVGDGQHGTARWATKKEIHKTYEYVKFTPKKWRNQAEKGLTPTVSRRKIVYPMKVKLKLFFKWGIEFEENYVVPEQVDRKIEYATKDEIISGIGNKYKSKVKTKKKDRPYPSTSHHANEQKQMHHSEHEEKTDDLESPKNRPKSQLVTNINKSKETVEKVQQRYEEQVFAEGINKQ